MKRRSIYAKVMYTCVALFWIVSILLPLAAMLAHMADIDVAALLSGRTFQKALRQSLAVTATATCFSVALAAMLAWATVRTDIRGKGVFGVLLTLPMLIPSISHGMGLVLLFGGNGILHNLLHLQGTIYGFWGIVVASVMYSFPVAYLMIADILRYEDSTPYEAARVLGISKPRRLLAITAPYMRRPMISVVFAVFTMIFTDYGVPLTVGGKYKTLPVVMYEDVIGLLDFGKGSVIGVILLLPALVAFILDLTGKEGGSGAFVHRPFDISHRKGRNAAAYALCAVVSLFVLLPIASFAFLSVVDKYPVSLQLSSRHVLQALDMGAGQYLRNSVVIALGVSCIGVFVATLTAYLTARMRLRFSRMLHLLSITSLAIPGIVLGLSYALFFKSTFLYGTFAILILANLMHFFASPYLMMYNTFGKLNGDLEAVGRTLGIGRLRILWNVLLPQASGTIAEMFSYFFVNSMMTISAVSFLANVSTKPLALMINQFEAQMMLECTALVSLVILAVNLLMKGIVAGIKRKLCKG